MSGMCQICNLDFAQANVMRQTKEGRGKLQDAKAKQDQLNEARQTVRALHMAVKAGQEQVAAPASKLARGCLCIVS